LPVHLGPWKVGSKIEEDHIARRVQPVAFFPTMPGIHHQKRQVNLVKLRC